jgi:hypothetical protein
MSIEFGKRVGGRRASESARVRRLHIHASAPVVLVADDHAPRLAAHLTVLDVLLRASAPGIERDLVELATVGTANLRLGVGGAVAQREFAIEEVVHAWKLREDGVGRGVGACGEISPLDPNATLIPTPVFGTLLTFGATAASASPWRATSAANHQQEAVRCTVIA